VKNSIALKKRKNQNSKIQNRLKADNSKLKIQNSKLRFGAGWGFKKHPIMQLTIRISEHAMSFSKREADGTIRHEPYHMKSGVSTAANLRQAFNDSHMLAEQHRSARVLIDTPVLVIPADE